MSFFPASFSCFISHIGVFFGAFLGPILLIIVFNTCSFITVVVVLVRRTLAKENRKLSKNKLSLTPKEACKMILSLSGIMSLLGLTWVLSVFTFRTPNPNAAFALQWLFVFFNSFQGFFVFFFFVVLSADARNSWLILRYPCYKSTKALTGKSHLHHASEISSTKKQSSFPSNEISCMTLPKIGVEDQSEACFTKKRSHHTEIDVTSESVQ